MKGIASWVLAIFVVVIIGLVVDILFSDSRMAKFMRTATACITVLLLVMPFPGLFKNGFHFDAGTLMQYDYPPDAGYLNYADAYRSGRLAAGVAEALKNDGVSGAEVTVNATYAGAQANIVQVVINLDKVVIDQKKQHINKNELVVNLVGGYLQIDKSKVVTV
ncbi:MAG: hypothetical protein LBH24_07020 [Clostridiales bacterium]|jgi:hypothetical protein|nr:hypothetical protein [Clostridiales bacterium]